VAKYGPQYEALYDAYLAYSQPDWFSPKYNWTSPEFYGPPRQLRIGVRLEY
jgi:hypothetical protein